MEENRRPPELAAGIASISPVVGCTSGCAYCYIGLEKAGRPAVNEYGVENTRACLLSTPFFRRGKQGTILCFGGWGEMFPPVAALREESLNWIDALAKLGNPMVLFTKAVLSDEEIGRLKNSQIYENQLLLLVTITCLRNSRELEPHTDSPQDRLAFISRWVAKDLPAGVLINPFLREYSLSDYDLLLSLLAAIPLVGIAVSPLYLNGALMERIKRIPVLQPVYHRLMERGLETGIHMSNERFRVYADDMEDLYPSLLRESRAYGLLTWKHYLCLIMNHFHQFNFDVFKKEPCIDCGHCRQVASI